MAKDKHKKAGRPDRRSKSNSRSAASNHSPESSEHTSRLYANFVIPLAGVLSAFAARLYDMGDQDVEETRRSNGHANENSPLLGDPTTEGSQTGTKRTLNWFVRHAVSELFSERMVVNVIAELRLLGHNMHWFTSHRRNHYTVCVFWRFV